VQPPFRGQNERYGKRFFYAEDQGLIAGVDERAARAAQLVLPACE
jgi:hypothetical protein